MMLARKFGASSASNSAAIRPMNPPISAEPNVASSDATIIDRIPNSLAEGCQVVPLMKFQSPISRRAGMPWMNRKITITDSAITAAAAQRKNTLSVMRSRTLNTFFVFPFFAVAPAAACWTFASIVLLPGDPLVAHTKGMVNSCQ